METLIAVLLVVAIISVMLNFKLWADVNDMKERIDTRDEYIKKLKERIEAVQGERDNYKQMSYDVLKQYSKLEKEMYPNSGWISPVASEREWQVNQLKKLYPDYPNGPTFQYLNGLITLACKQVGIEVDKI